MRFSLGTARSLRPTKQFTRTAIAALCLGMAPIPAMSDAETLRALSAPEFGLALATEMRIVQLKGGAPVLPRLRNELIELDTYPITANQPVIYFPRISVPYQGSEWVPIVTESGLWGMIRREQNGYRRLLTQSDVEEILEIYGRTRQSWVMVTKRIDLANGLIVLTPGEIFPVDLLSPIRIVLYRDSSITRSKYSDVIAISSRLSDVTIKDDSVSVPLSDNYVGSFEYLELTSLNDYYEPASTSVGFFSSISREIFSGWTKFFLTPQVQIVSCNQISKITQDQTAKAELSGKIEANLDGADGALGAVLSAIGLKLEVVAGASLAASQNITSTMTLSGKSFTFDLITREVAGTATSYFFGSSQGCKKTDDSTAENPVFEEDGPKFYRLSKSGTTGFVLDKAAFDRLTSELDTLNWNELSGTIKTPCYTRDFEGVQKFLKDELDLTASEADYIGSRILDIPEDTEAFHSC